MVKVKLPDGREVNGFFEKIEDTKEHWNDYTLKDDTVVRVKTVVSEIYRLDDKDPATGKPNFLVKSSTILSVVMPDEK